MNITERLTQNEQKLQKTQTELQQLEQAKQDLLQELLRLDGEHRLLLELQSEKPKVELK